MKRPRASTAWRTICDPHGSLLSRLLGGRSATQGGRLATTSRTVPCRGTTSGRLQFCAPASQARFKSEEHVAAAGRKFRPHLIGTSIASWAFGLPTHGLLEPREVRRSSSDG